MSLLPPEDLAKMLRKKRDGTGKSQKFVAGQAELSPSQVNRIEKNSVNPSYEAVYSLWDALEDLEEQEFESAAEFMNEEIEWVEETDTLEEAKKIMTENDFSQLPVKSGEKPVGSITNNTIMNASDPDLEVGEVMEGSFLELPASAEPSVLQEILKYDKAVLIKEKNQYKGIITKQDMFKGLN